MIRACTVAAAVAVAVAAAPPSGVNTLTAPSFSVTPAQRAAPATSGFTPAPVPNPDAAGPSGPRAGRDAELAPSFFTRSNQYRGEGYSANSSSQIQQDRRVQPGAGVNLRVPLQ